MAKILLVEDEINIASFIKRGLTESGHEVSVATDGMAGWELLEKEKFQLLILDIIMPKMTGLELCRKFRQKQGFYTPVVMLTALGTTDDIVKGLEAGADDYLVKPFRFQELQARVNAMLRRLGSDVAVPHTLQYADLCLDPDTHRAVRNGKVVELTVREYRLLEYLLLHKETPVSRADLITHVWDKEPDRNMNVVDVYVNYLRGKIDKGFRKKLIRTVTGVGYMLEV
ncbi:DNA-binding response regulator [Parabacteroides sp. 52]|uniref:response regulator transcription factor n=1 Tax=unclassified Parabacteroides TaxID=2649774 RepID=UPI0013CF4439|nr:MULTISPECIES: response regulator transcription factor [unclassified Parabacteroides]MDH6533585.1 DNA-binding response OmpR family regulator [Parabacteroides sp. PM5-20]NDV54337.1 DNA-binding response regulator [Parabacteroides sp. 52]